MPLIVNIVVCFGLAVLWEKACPIPPIAVRKENE